MIFIILFGLMFVGSIFLLYIYSESESENIIACVAIITAISGFVLSGLILSLVFSYIDSIDNLERIAELKYELTYAELINPNIIDSLKEEAYDLNVWLAHSRITNNTIWDAWIPNAVETTEFINFK